MKFKEMPKLPLVLVAVMFAIGLSVYPRLPARIRVHWNAMGQIDGWAAKSFLSVFDGPLMALGIYTLFMVLPYFDPKRRNLYKSKHVYFLVLDLVTALAVLTFVGGLAAAFNRSLPVDRLVAGGIGVMLVVLGNYMGRVKRNWTMGVRFAWTLSDDEVWAKTNRLGGRLFVIAGMVAIVGVLLPAPWGIAAMLATLLAMLPITYIYSMRLYKRLHPEETQPPAPSAPTSYNGRRE